MARLTLKAAVLSIFISLTYGLPSQFQGVSHIFTSGQSGGAQTKFVNEDGITTGQCAYTDDQGRNVKLSYTEYPDGRVEVKSRQSFVTDPKAALKECQKQVRVGQSHLEDQLRQDLFGVYDIAGDTGVSSFSSAGFPSSFDVNIPSAGGFLGSSSWGGNLPGQGDGSFTGSSFFSSNIPTQDSGIYQVSSGNHGANIVVLRQDGVTTGVCSYVDEQGRTVKINYTEKPDGTVDADSPQDFVTDPVASLGPCREAVTRQQEEIQQQTQQLQDNLRLQQQHFQDNLRRQQQSLQDQLAQMQANLQRQQQQFQNIFNSGQFPFNFPYYDGPDYY